MPGEGEPGINGGPPGDLYVYVQVKPHKVFQRRGFDIYCEIPITFIQAALGDEVEVPVLDGSGSIKVPEGTQTGASFTLKGKGIPHIRGNRRGDQIVFVKVVTPTRLTEKQKELLRKFEQEEEKKHERKGIFNKVKDAFTG
jgi:molecular chaperone DnaJ